MIKKILLFTLLPILLFCAGGYTVWRTIEPRTVYLPCYINVPYYLDRDVVHYIVINRMGVREFQSLDELKAWLAEDKTSEHEYIPTTYDCDDFALDLVKSALNDGYQIFAVPLLHHVFCCAFIGNEIYYIEPQTDDVWLYALRD